MAVFCTKVRRCVAIDIFGIKICTRHKESLNDSEVAPDASNVQWGSKILCSWIN